MISEKDVENFDKIAKRITCYLHPVKGRMIQALLNQEMFGNELDEYMRLEQSVGAQFRSALRAEGFLITRKKGKYVYFRTDADALNKQYGLCMALCEQARIVRDEAPKCAQRRIRAINHLLRISLLEEVASKKDYTLCQRDLCKALGLVQSVASNHIKTLVQSGFLSQKGSGRLALYKANKISLKSFLKTAKTAEKWITK